MEEKQLNASSTFEEHFDEKNIEIIGAHSITEETFETWGLNPLQKAI